MLCQVTSVYRDRGKASIVTSYGEHLGVHPIQNLRYVSQDPLFNKRDYTEGTVVIWVEGEDVY